MTRIFTLALVLALAIPGAVMAYGGDGGGDSATGLSRSTTNKVVKVLRRGGEACQRLDKSYRYDCYRQAYRQAARLLNGMPDYAPAQQAIEDVEKVLERTIARNIDPSQPNLRRGVQTFRPIKPAAIPQAKRDFIGALDRAETKLLRSADNNVHFVKIAEALNTNKVLLRSALLAIPAVGFPVAAALVLALPASSEAKL